MRRTIFAIIVAAGASASVTAAWGQEAPNLYEQLKDNKPTVGSVQTVSLGDRMLVQRSGEYRDCIVPQFSHTFKVFGPSIVIEANRPFCKARPSAKAFLSSYNNIPEASSSPFVRRGAAPGPTFYEMKIADTKSGGLVMCLYYMGLKAVCLEDKTRADFEVGPWFIYSENTIQQTIEYMGKTGDILTFVYSEFSDGFARQAFTREFKVDLAEGDLAAFKGAVLKIHSATNVGIEYEVVKEFN